MPGYGIGTVSRVINNQPGVSDAVNISSIAIDDTLAAYDMTRYILGKGHRKICVIGGHCRQKRGYHTGKDT